MCCRRRRSCTRPPASRTTLHCSRKEGGSTLVDQRFKSNAKPKNIAMVKPLARGTMGFGCFALEKTTTSGLEAREALSTEPICTPLVSSSSSSDTTDGSPRYNIAPKPRASEPLPSTRPCRYRFINTARPCDANASALRKTVRSQAARLKPFEDDPDIVTKPKRRKRQPRLNRTVTFRIEYRIKEAVTRALKRVDSPDARPKVPTARHKSTLTLHNSPNGGWCSPFPRPQSQSHACAPFLFHHCKWTFFTRTHV